MPTPLWQPTAERIAAANLTAFIRYVREQCSADIADYWALYHWSIAERAKFWEALWRFCGVRAQRPWDDVLVDGDRLPGARWFVGAQLNFADNLLGEPDDHPAIIFWNEQGAQQTYTAAELHRAVAQVAAALRREGVRSGDRVAGILPNIPEALIAFLAASSLGAVWSLCSPDFGVQGVLDRFGQIEPRVLMAVDGYTYGGKSFDCREKLREICSRLPSVERVVVVPYAASTASDDDIPSAVRWADWIDRSAEKIEFAPLPFDHPLYILYSSGTTGVPKCIVHGAGGALLKHLSELVLHADLKPGERIFYYTTTGWMMWNWLISALAARGTVVLYDGSPLGPNQCVLFDLVEREKLHVFGTSPKYLQAAAKAGLEPRTSHDLSSLRLILSTGAPLNGDGFDYVYQHVKPDVHLVSMSGGTDLVGSFASGCPLLPVYRGEMQTPVLGMQVEVFDESGRSLPRGPGELVCTAAFPSVPRGFWNDPGNRKFQQTYFARYPNVWHHGDWCEFTEQRGMIIHGRSDAVLNPGGVRIGTAEIYRQVETLPEVLESLAVGQQWEGDVRIVLFVKLRADLMLGDALREQIRQTIRRNATPRHVPAKIIQVADIPRTKSGKIVELAVRDIIHGRPVKNAEALSNPEALELFRDLEELR